MLSRHCEELSLLCKFFHKSESNKLQKEMRTERNDVKFILSCYEEMKLSISNSDF